MTQPQKTQPPDINGYQRLRLLGRGNTSLVYLVTDPEGRKQALKLPFAETLADPEAAERFANEVRVSLRLRHERLVIGYAGQHFGEGAFLAMRYFPEGTLSRWLDLGRLSTPEGLRIVGDVIAALVFLHRQGVVHQDIKPQNVYLDASRAALGDFGAAYFIAQGGKTAGSPFYMAPEIYLGEASSAKSDVYSLGVLAYETLGGERPFAASSYDALMNAHLNSYARPLGHLNRDIAPEVSRLIERCLAKKPENRPDIFEVAEVLGRQLQDSLLGEAPEPAPKAIVKTAILPTGRHGPLTTPESQRAAPADKPDKLGASDKDRPRGWNPFKRRG